MSKKNQIILFSVLLTLFVTILTSISYLLVYYTTAQNRLKSRIFFEAEEIIAQHITIVDGRINYVQNNDGSTIETDLQSDQLSAVIYNQDGKIVGKFGLAQIREEENELLDISVFSESVKQSLLTSQIQYYGKLAWKEEQDYIAIAYPVKKENTIFGSILVVAPTQEWNTSLKLSLINLLSILPISLALTILTSSFISSFAFRELSQLNVKMKKISSERLDENLEYKGKKDDEIAKLIVSYNEMLSRLKEGIDRQNMFVSNASHEIYTPIARAVSTLEVLRLKKEFDDEEIASVIDDLSQLNNMTKALLTLSKSKDQNNLRFEKVNIFNLVQKVVDKSSDEINKKGIKVGNNVLKDIEIESNEDYLLILIENIVSNAIKYNIINGSLTIDSRIFENTLELSFVDTGIGMSKIDLKHAHERFYRGKAQVASGSGLGLAIVDEISKKLEIKVNIESELNMGTRVVFSFKLP